MGFFTKTMTLAAASCLAATLTFAPAHAAGRPGRRGEVPPIRPAPSRVTDRPVPS